MPDWIRRASMRVINEAVQCEPLVGDDGPVKTWAFDAEIVERIIKEEYERRD